MYLRLIALASLLGLAGCLGGNTYGTGVTQEAQLLSDVAGLVTLGSRDKKEQINYSARPDLVRAPDGTVLPQPVDNVASADGSFPVDPEERRAALLAGADTTAEGSSLTVEGVERPAIAKPELIGDLDRDGGIDIRKQKVARERVLAARKRARGATGSGARRYLTDPPIEYRTPAESAAVGEIGERERRERKATTNDPSNAPGF